MAIRINSNVDAGSASRNLATSQAQLGGALERLASGRRINRGADDAAGLAISQRLSAQVRGLNQATRNTQDAVSLVQTAEGGLSQTSESLQRIRELTVQAGNGTLSADQRGAIQAEISELTSTIDRIATNTEFNGQKILDGSNPSLQTQTGPNTTDVTTVDLPDASSTALGVGPGQVDVTTAATSNASLANIDQAISNVSSARADLGAQQNGLERIIASNDVGAENQASAGSRIADLDYAKGVSDQARSQILSQLGTAVLAHANLSRQSVLRLLQ